MPKYAPVQIAFTDNVFKQNRKNVVSADVTISSPYSSGLTLTDKDIICLQLLGLQVNGVNYVSQLQLAGV